jgi:glyoxylase-like metal-dependent hydrolase (beta-lactamase superfamily II)
MEIIEISNFSNSYLLKSKTVYLIDANDKEKVVKNTKKLDYIFITHAHYDHISDLYNIISFFNFKPRVFCHELERKYVEGLKILKRNFFDFVSVKKIYAEGFFGEKLKINKNVELIHTPGHTEGSISVFFKREKIIFLGDLLVRNKFGFLDMSEEKNQDIDLIKESLKKIINLDFKYAYLGHGKRASKSEIKKFIHCL